MFEPNITAIRYLVSIIKNIIGQFKRPFVLNRHAPKNLFDHIKPGISLAKAKEILGIPSYEYDGYVSYKFSDAYIQINTKENIVNGVCLALPKITRRSTFRVYPLEFILGKNSLKDVLIDGEPAYQYDNSSKHSRFQTKLFFGYDGNYFNYIFGVISAPHIQPPTNIKWYSENEGELGVVITGPSEIIPNMVCVLPLNIEEMNFNFWIFH